MVISSWAADDDDEGVGGEAKRTDGWMDITGSGPTKSCVPHHQPVNEQNPAAVFNLRHKKDISL
jgi:hypothetical protein